MYTGEQLSKIPFFHKLLETEGMEDILDSLTGLIARGKMLNFAQSLIDEQTPFTFAILDLDNFKTINDTYGHKVGDEVLSQVAKELIDFVGEDGVAGRFGGDEFLIIHFKIRSYQEKKDFCHRLYRGDTVLKKHLESADGNPFITGTLGCASFPEDAKNYDELFDLTDKTLYRGKTKGRNCYVIYVEQKHKNIDIQKMASHSLYATFRDMAVQFDSTPDIYEKMRRIYGVLKEMLWITDLYYVNAGMQMKSINEKESIGSVSDMEQLMTDEVYAANELEEIRKISPITYQTLSKREIETFVVVRVGMGPFTFGYIMCAEPRSHRIWQDDEFAILFSLSRMLAGFIRGAGITLE